MTHLNNVSQEELRDVLELVEEKQAAMRIIAAIAYKNGITQTELSQWYGVERKTIYNWLTRLDNGDLNEAVTDESRPGRPRKLSQTSLREFQNLLQNPPREVGIEAHSWTPQSVQDFLQEEYGVEYSLTSCRRLMKEAGLTYRRVKSKPNFWTMDKNTKQE